MSARDVLRERVARVLYESTEPIIPWEKILDGDLRTYRFLADKVLDALRAHPVELLALLAEPKVCETCGGHGEAQWLASCSECGGLGLDPLVIRDDVPCPSCHGSGSVTVDVLDLLVQAGLVEVVGHMKAHPLEILPTRPVFAAKDGTP